MGIKVRLAEMILYEDDHYLVINKPPFISTLEDRADNLNILKLVREKIPSATVCHRIDKDTSGALAIAKGLEAYRHTSIQFENRTVKKTYHAVVDGIQRFEGKWVDEPILKMDDGVARINRLEGKPAQTCFTTLSIYRQNTLVECLPVTGRMHQIRVHLALLKAPITGDDLYGGRPFFLSAVKKDFHLKKHTEEQPIMKRMALHAFSLEFEGMDGKTIKIEAPYPKDFGALVRQLEQNR